jgi:hypothetical protein
MEKISTLGDKFLENFQSIPGYAEKFNPGISQLQVQKILLSLEKELPHDFYELYKWRNGYSDFCGHPDFNIYSFAPFHFSTIEMVNTERNWEWCRENTPTFKGSEVLPFVSGDRIFWGILLDRNYKDSAHIVYVNTVGECHLRYDSISSMMSTIVEGFETGALYFDEDGFLEKNHQLFLDVVRKNNPKVLCEATADFENNIGIYGTGENLDSVDYTSRVISLLNSLSALYYMKPPDIIERCQQRVAGSMSVWRQVEMLIQRDLMVKSSVEL